MPTRNHRFTTRVFSSLMQIWETTRERRWVRPAVLVILTLGALRIAVAQEAPQGAQSAQKSEQGRALGVVTKVDTDARQITLKNDAGAEVAVALTPKASFRRVAPGETNLANAATIELGDIHAGDRVLARGKADDAKSLTANLIVVMSSADIASKQAAERADWDRRGATGIVSDAGADQITISIRTIAGVTPLVIKPAPNAIVRRYAPDSVKFADAKPSSFAEIKKGDQVRARGNKSGTPGGPEAQVMTADEVVSGQFKMIAGVILSVDTTENLITINNIETKKPMIVKISADSSVKKLPVQLAQTIANRLHGVTDEAAGGAQGGAPRGGNPGGGTRDGAGAPAGGGTPGDAAPGGAGNGAGRGEGGGRGGFAGGGRGGGRGDLQSMIERIPAITLADLMPGGAIIVSSTVGANADQVTAITALAGVEPILTKPGTREMSLGSWNMNGGAELGGIGQ